MGILMSTGKVVGSYLRAVYMKTLFLKAVIWRPGGGLTGGRLGGRESKKQWCGVRRRPLEKRCWKWSELGKVKAFGVQMK